MENFGIVIVCATFTLAIWEYHKRTKIQKFEVLERFRKRYMELKDPMEGLLELTDQQNEEFSQFVTAPDNLGKINDFLGLYEELAITVNSEVLAKEVAYYMFGYYAIKCNSPKFWQAYY